MIAWLTDTLIYTGALIALMLAARRPVARHFGAQMGYALWALPLVRFVMPPVVLPASFAPQASETTVTTTTTVVTDGAVALPAGLVLTPVYEPSFWQVWGGMIIGATAAIWLAGALTFLAWRAWTYVQMREWLLQGARPVGEAGKVRLMESPAVSSPVAFGVSDKVVALPMGFMAAENRAARDLAIEHELAHHRGRDLLANILAQPILALHWFNPLAWMGWRAMRRDQEAACDARVIAARGPRERAVYGQVIASFASGQRLALAAPMACPVLGEKSIIHRLRSLGMDEISPRRRLAGRALLAGAALALPFTASISYAEVAALPEVPAVPEPSGAARSFTIVDVPEGADPSDATLHTRVIQKDGQTIILKTARPFTEEEAQASVERAQAAMRKAQAATADQGRALADMRQAMSDKDAAEEGARWAKFGEAWARQGDQSAKAGEAWAKWGEQFGKKWEKWGEQFGKGFAPPTPPTPPSPPAPAAPAAPVAAVELPVPAYGCDRDGNLMKIGSRGGNAGQALAWCPKVADANANARRALIQARARIAGDRQMDPDARETVLDALDNEIEHLDDIAEANS